MSELEQLWRKARCQEQFTRELAYLECLSEHIGPVSVVPLCPIHVSALRCLGSPFVWGGNCDVEDLAKFLWHVSEERANGASEKAHAKLDLRLRRMFSCDAEYFLGVVNAAREYIREAFMDSPPHCPTAFTDSYYSDSAGLCDTFGNAYGWANDVTMRTPYKQLFQQLKLITARERARSGKRPVFYNPSDIIRGQMLDELIKEDADTRRGNTN